MLWRLEAIYYKILSKMPGSEKVLNKCLFLYLYLGFFRKLFYFGNHSQFSCHFEANLIIYVHEKRFHFNSCLHFKHNSLQKIMNNIASQKAVCKCCCMHSTVPEWYLCIQCWEDSCEYCWKNPLEVNVFFQGKLIMPKT